MIDINVKGLLYVSKAIIPQMIERKSGHIINIGSTAAKKFIQMEMYIAPQNTL
jgi:NADP-dependent 3-hydroxy acid dehydrogenase YdfG